MEEDREQARQAQLQQLVQAAKGTFWDYLGCELIRLEDRRVVVGLTAGRHHLNLIGLVNGGVLSSLLDNAMGIIVMLARPGEKVVTTNLNVQFVAPLYEGPLIVTAELLHQSRKMMTTLGRVTDGEGRLGTLGSGSFRVI
ncbi:PaaI family thioesterase [Paenibacillus athensensis]|uniref:Thioesterase n=2 Tax=Paenibacillus athensensis TaxID=1967502 RepID=A0A4Y8QAV6_9BACL|nr:PaaI family thioesterase [Paenibacillus athensensis]